MDRENYNIYCDESCHLENDGQKVMVLGAVWCPKSLSHEIFQRIRDIKEKHNLNHNYEIKWNKVSKTKIDFFLDLIDFYFDDDHLHYRALIIPDKGILKHSEFNQTHDDFYYKMYFRLLKVILDPLSSYNIYLDIKDTQSQRKVEKLQEVLRSSKYDYSHQIIKNIQQVRSHEVELIQLSDFFTGAISYLHRNLLTSEAKLKLIEKIKYRSKYSLLNSTLFREDKMNIFVWSPKKDTSNAI